MNASITTTLGLLLSLTFSVAAPPEPAHQGWSRFRGPNGSGVAPHAQPPLKPSEAHIAWKMPVAYGQSSPVLWGNRLFLTAIEDDNTLFTIAMDRQTGKTLWRRAMPSAPLEKVHVANSPTASTPCVDAERVYVYFGSFGLLCYDHEGNELWQKKIPTPKSLYGMSTSPILFEETVIMILDNDANLPDSKLSQSKAIALNKTTGEQVWETARPFNRSGWSTPCLLPNGDEPELVVLGHGRVYGYDARSGAEKWFVNGFSRETISAPIAGEGHVFVSASMLGGVSDEQPDREPFWTALLPYDTNGDGKLERSEMTGRFTFPIRPSLPLDHPGFGIPLPKDPAKRKERQDGFMRWVDKDKDGFWTKEEFINHLSFNRGKPNLMAIKPGGSGDVTESHVSWALHRGIPEIPSPVLYNDRIYMVRNGGVLTAVDATNGKTVYRKRLGTTGQYSPSPVIAHEHLFIASSEGMLSIVPAGDEFEVIHAHDLKEEIAATPAIDKDTLYLRTKTHLIAFRQVE